MILADCSMRRGSHGQEKLGLRRVLNIDHHISNEHFAQWEYMSGRIPK